MRKIRIVCPICSKSRKIELNNTIFETDQGYLLKFPIIKDTICNHEFIAILDYNFSIRDYEIPINSLYH